MTDSPFPAPADVAAPARPAEPTDAARAARSVRAAEGFGTAVLVATSVPIAALGLPNVVALAVPAMLGEGMVTAPGVPGVLRAAGLALPLAVLTAALVTIALRAVRPWVPLLAGLALLGAGYLLGGAVDSVGLLALDRCLHGVGAGAVLPATLAVAAGRTDRTRAPMLAWWAAVFVGCLLGAVPLVYRVLLGQDWHVLLRPYPVLLVAAAAVAVAHAVLFRGGRSADRAGEPADPAGEPADQAGAEGASRAPQGRRAGSGLVALAPAPAIAVLAVAMTYQWSPFAQLAACVLAVALLLAAAAFAAADAGSASPLGFPLVAVATGLIGLHAVGTVVSQRSIDVGVVAGLRSLWVPLLAGGMAMLGAVAAALVAARAVGSRRCLPLVVVGLVTSAVGLVVLLAVTPVSAGRSLILPFVLLGAGLGLAAGAALLDTPVAGALIGLSLGLAGVLTGYLLAGALTAREVAEAGAADGLSVLAYRAASVDAVHLWQVSAALVALAAALGVGFAARADRAEEITEPGQG